MGFEKIKSFLKEYNDIKDYYFFNKPITWFFIFIILLTPFIYLFFYFVKHNIIVAAIMLPSIVVLLSCLANFILYIMDKYIKKDTFKNTENILTIISLILLIFIILLFIFKQILFYFFNLIYLLFKFDDTNSIPKQTLFFWLTGIETGLPLILIFKLFLFIKKKPQLELKEDNNYENI